MALPKAIVFPRRALTDQSMTLYSKRDLFGKNKPLVACLPGASQARKRVSEFDGCFDRVWKGTAAMSEKDLFYRHLLQQCQSPDLSQRLAALEDLSKLDYLDLVPGQFLLDRLNSTSIEREQSAILEVMSQLPLPIPVEALLTILADRETSTTHLRAEVAHTLAVVKAKTAIAPLLRLLQEPSEDPDLRREIAEDLESFGSDMPFDVLIATVADPDIDI